MVGKVFGKAFLSCILIGENCISLTFFICDYFPASRRDAPFVLIQLWVHPFRMQESLEGYVFYRAFHPFGMRKKIRDMIRAGGIAFAI